MSENQPYPQDRSAAEQQYQEYSQPPAYEENATQPYQQSYPPPYPQYAAPAPYTLVRDHPQSVLVFVLGLLSVLGLTILGPFGWYFGRKVIREIDAAPPGSYTNRGLAMAGMVLGIIGTVFLILIAVIVVVAIVAAIVAGGSASSTY